MAAPAVLKIDIVANASKALAAMKDTEQGAAGIESGFSKVGKVVGGALGTAAVVSFGKASIDAATESAVATARLEQVFSSMGDTTGEAAKAAESYASSLSKKIGVEDESILAAQAQLATFGAVSDATARQAGVFDRATAAAADLAAAGFGSLDTNAVQLGKALQDPTKGMTALAKSGVTFTDAQKDQIKALQDSGDLLAAQQIVLGAVESQVKGTAEATVTSQQKAALAFGELQEQIGAKLLPVVKILSDLFVKYGNILLPLAGVIAAIVAATKIWTAIQTAFNLVMAANPIVLVVLAIAALVAAVILAYTKVEWFRNFVDAAFQAVVTAFNFVKDAAVAVFQWIVDNWPLLLAVLLGPFGILIAVVVKNFDTILDVIKGVISWIASNWPLLLAILTGPIGLAVLFIIRNWETIENAARAMVDWVMDRFRDLSGFISRIADTLSGIMGSIVDAIKRPIEAAASMVSSVIEKFQSLIDFVRNIATTIGGFVTDIVDAFKGPLNGIIRAWNAVEFTVPKVEVLGQTLFGGATIGLPNIPELARGGVVLSTGLAVVHEGERFSGVGKSFGATTVNINVSTTGLGADAPQIQRAVVRALRGYQARNGALDIAVTRGV